MTALDDFFTHYYARRPVNATFTGVHAYDDKLPDWSPEGLAAMDDEMRALGEALAREYPAPPSASAFRNSPDLLDAELARGFLEIQRAENASMHGPRGNPALWTGEAIFSIVSLMLRDFAPIDERIELATARLNALREFLLTSPKANVVFESGGMTAAVATAPSPDEPMRPLDVRMPIPRAWIDRVSRDCKGAESLLTRGFREWLQWEDLPVEQGHLVVRPDFGFAQIRRFRAKLAIQATLHSDAFEPAMACGPELFDLLLARGHFCTRPRADLLVDARERLDAARAELDLLAKSVAGSWAEAQIQFAANRPTPDKYFAAFNECWAACHKMVVDANAIGWPDEWRIRYEQYPPWAARAAQDLYFLHYRSPAPFDPPSTNYYLVPDVPADPAEADKHVRVWNHATIKLNHVVHHGAIGHHVQNWYAYNQQRSRIGKVAAVDCANRIGMFCGGTMAEGWACYATDLMEELGFLTPLERVAQQHTRVRMLARAIVDIELHQGTMSFGDCVRFYTEAVGMSAEAATGEAVKNSMFPCTAIMYWLGTQGIHDLRAEMKRREGPRFSLRRFHGELLGYGSIPVPLVARMMTESPRPG